MSWNTGGAWLMIAGMLAIVVIVATALSDAFRESVARVLRTWWTSLEGWAWVALLRVTAWWLTRGERRR